MNYNAIPVNDAIVPVRMVLKAGVPQSANVNGEFVFIDQGRDLTIRFNGSIISGRKSGDVMRGRGEYREVTVISPYDQTIDLVLGFGDYNRLIVSGEMNISAYVSTRKNGVAKSLPMEIAREVGIASTGETVYSQNTNEYQSGDIDLAGASGCFYFAGDFWVIGENGVYYRFNTDDADGTFKETGNWSGANANMMGATVAPDGTIYWRDTNDVYRMEIGEWQSVKITSGLGGGYIGWRGSMDGGIHYFNGRLYTLNDQHEITSIAVDGTDPRIEHAGVWNQYLRLSGYGDRFRINGPVPGHVYRILASGRVERVESEDSNWGSGSNADAYSPDTLLFCNLQHSYGFRIQHTRSVTTYGTLYHQPVGDASRRVLVPQFAPLKSWSNAGGTVVKSDWVGEVLGSLGGGEDYGDFLTGYTFDNGVIGQEVSSGTETFTLRGMSVSDLAVLDGSTLKIKILPEYFGA